MTMDLGEVRKHWERRAREFGPDPRATDNATTRKALEIDALQRAIQRGRPIGAPATMLEVGCGTGYNCLAVAATFPEAQICGVDLVADMVDNARALAARDGVANVQYAQGDILALAEADLPFASFDVVFTNRCIINLNTDDLHRRAIGLLAGRVASQGLLILVENPRHKFERQNRCREVLGLPVRSSPPFNLLLNEASCIDAAEQAGLTLLDTDDFSSLHDILLYVLIPATNGGTIDYAHPLLQPATNLSQRLFSDELNAFGALGQNRLYLFRKS